MITAAGLVVAATLMGAGLDDSIHLTMLSTGASKKIGSYAPQRAKLSDKQPEAVKKLPSGLASPMFGEMAIGAGGKTYLILDEPDGKPAKLFVDSNSNGDFTDDAPAEWTSKENKGKDDKVTTMYNGGAMVNIGDSAKPTPVHLNMYRFDKTDPAHAAQKDLVLYYRDYALEGDVTVGGKPYKAMVSDDNASGDFRGNAKSGTASGVKILIDVNGNGKYEARTESFDIRKPFNIEGKTWQVADMTRTGDSFKITPSKEEVAEVPDTGKTIQSFQAKAHDGKMIKFPSDYKGKIVLIDFWATWCGPCMAEMPNVVETYKKFHSKGFEIQGVSLDNANSIKKMDSVMKESGMTWSQIADGQGWNAEIAKKFEIHSIPATFLVDGTTGKILGVNLRGAALSTAVEKALAEKKGKS